MRRIPGICMLLILLLPGCKSDERILEELGMIRTTAYDQAEDGKLKVTVSIPVTDPNSQITREVLTATTISSKEARLKFAQQTERTVVSGQIRSALFGSRLAKAGLERHIDTLLRDPSIALGLDLILVEGDAGDILAKNYKQHPDTGQYLDHLLDKEAEMHTVPHVTLFEFSRDFNDDGVDPVIPVVKDNGTNARADGIALFRGDRYVAKIPVEEGIVFSLFRDKIRMGEIALNIGESEGKKTVVMFSSLVSRHKVRVFRQGPKDFKVRIDVGVSGSVLEYTGPHDLSKKEERKALEQEISADVTSMGNRMVKEMQRNQADCLGIGQYVRNSLSYREWKSLNWREVYSGIEVECHARVTIKNYGKYT